MKKFTISNPKTGHPVRSFRFSAKRLSLSAIDYAAKCSGGWLPTFGGEMGKEAAEQWFSGGIAKRQTSVDKSDSMI